MKIVQPIAASDTGTFSRASTATYYNSSGIITLAAINERRISFNPSDLTAASSELIEGAATNTILQSSSFENVVWSKSNLSVLSDLSSDPAGTTTTDLIVENVGGGAKTILQNALAVVNGLTYTYSVYARIGARQYMYMVLDPTRFSAGNVYFDLINGISVNSGSVSSSVQALPNGWYRCAVTATATSSGTGFVASVSPSITLGDSGSYTGDGSTSISLFGAQLEIGTSTTSYIATTTVSVSRAADVPASNFRSNIAENDFPIWSSATTYALGAQVMVVGTNVHQTYESLQAGNTNHDPATSATFWLPLGATNRWRLNDQSVQSQSSIANILHVSYILSAAVDTVAILNATGNSIRVVMTDPVEGVVYDQTKQLNSTLGIRNWYTYFYTPIDKKTDVVFENLPLYATATIDIYVNNIGSVAAVGQAVLGKVRDISYTKKGVEQGAKLSIQDYSLKQPDSFGNYYVKERAFSKKANYTVYVNGSEVDSIINLLTKRRALPTLYIGGADYGSSIIYGFYKSFEIDIAYIGMPAVCSIEIEGLT